MFYFRGGVDTEIIIQQVATTEQFDLALAYVRAIYKRKFGTFPKSLGKNCLIAECGEDIVGVIAMQFSEGERFEFENNFLLDFSILNQPRARCVSFGRWVATKPGAGNALMCAAVKHSIALGKTHSISCSKTETLRALHRRYGLRYDVLAVPVIAEQVLEEDRNFFLSKPSPCLCFALLSQWYDRLVLSVPAHVKINL